MANKYHVNKETGRANICRAQGACPLGDDAPHFDNKADAKAYIEQHEAENNDTFATMSKKSKKVDASIASQNDVMADLPSDADEFEDDFDDDAANAQAEQFALAASARSDSYSPREIKALKKFIATDSAFSEYSTTWDDTLKETLTAETEEDDMDAYDGDDYDSFSDEADGYGYDNEFPRFTGGVDFNSDDVVNTYYKNLKKDYGKEELSPTDEKQVKSTIKKVMNKYGLLEPLNYSAVTNFDEVEGFDCLGDTKGAMSELSSILHS